MSFSEEDKKFLSYLVVWLQDTVVCDLQSHKYKRLEHHELKADANELYRRAFESQSPDLGLFSHDKDADVYLKTDAVGDALTTDAIQHALRLLGSPPKRPLSAMTAKVESLAKTYLDSRNLSNRAEARAAYLAGYTAAINTLGAYKSAGVSDE